MVSLGTAMQKQITPYDPNNWIEETRKESKTSKGETKTIEVTKHMIKLQIVKRRSSPYNSGVGYYGQGMTIDIQTYIHIRIICIFRTDWLYEVGASIVLIDGVMILIMAGCVCCVVGMIGGYIGADYLSKTETKRNRPSSDACYHHNV